ncbi:MAG TPA: nucleotidyltransferase family protein [Flavisolibacter sp.]|nr:nucleotidyltransferase family protein [Flavisolibacter sp.]
MLSAIVLAAGTSTRMGDQNKLLLPFKSKTIIEITTENILGSGIEEVIVVLGHQQDDIQSKLKHLPLKFVYNSKYADGLTTSIQKGVEIASGDGYMLCLSDMYLVTANEYALMKQAFAQQSELNDQIICLPFYRGQRGNPVVFCSYYRNAILMHNEMNGCKNIITENRQHTYPVEMPSDHILTDMDYPADFEKLKNQQHK